MTIKPIPVSGLSEAPVVRTRSVPTAAALMLAGHKPTHTYHHSDNVVMIVFPAEAQDALDKFMTFKRYVDGLLEQEQEEKG